MVAGVWTGSVRRTGRLLAAVATLVTLAAALSGCGGGSTAPRVLGNLDGTQPECQVADNATTCAGTVVWQTFNAGSVALMVDGSTASTAGSGTLAPTVAFGHPATIALQADGQTLATASISAVCVPTSHWDGAACRPGAGFAVAGFAIEDGDTNVGATTVLLGTATQVLVGGSGNIACQDTLDADVVLATTVTVAVSGTQFTVQPTFAGYPMLPHRATCTLQVDVVNGSATTASVGPLTFSTDNGPVLDKLLVQGGSGGLPWVVDPATGAAVTPPEMAAHLGECFGAYDVHTARLRTLCGKSSGGLGNVWDIDPVTVHATQVDSLLDVFTNGTVSSADVQIDHFGVEYMTRGGLQADGTTNSSVVVITPTTHTTIAWDWGGRQDFVLRLLLDDANHRLYAISSLGLIKTIDTTTLAVISTLDATAQVNDATLSPAGQVVLAIAPLASGANLLVMDPASQSLLSGLPIVGPSGRATVATTLSAGDLLLSTSDFSHGVTTAMICRLDPVTYALRPGTPCTAVGDATPHALAALDGNVYGDINDVLTGWPAADFSTGTPVHTFDAAIARIGAVHN